jgi:hypothetical protein
MYRSYKVPTAPAFKKGSTDEVGAIGLINGKSVLPGPGGSRAIALPLRFLDLMPGPSPTAPATKAKLRAMVVGAW